ncbi:hypothetical protein IWW56_002628 [Coemansia sp. RSA 2131]|nr:hypothetical protein IWW56_002628 [Coemansia sp. RSA 2131]
MASTGLCVQMRLISLVAVVLASAALVSAHGEEMDKTGTLPEDAPFYKWPDEPMGWALKVHLVLCLIAYVVILPVGLVMEVASHRYQWLAQLSGAGIAFLGIVFGWVHGHLGNVYARYGWFMLSLLAQQTATNLGLTLDAVPRNKKSQLFYRMVGAMQLVCTYVGMLLGGIRFLNLCSQGHLGQCVSHFARGSALIIGAVCILVCMRVFGAIIVELRRPLELYLSIIMILVGAIGTFTEHNFFQTSDGDSWSHKDLQHTLIGVSWFAGGLLGVLMTCRSHPRSRNPIPSLIFIATGIAMITHQQDLVMASHTHFLFGAALVCLGLSTIAEITLLAAGFVKDHDQPALFQFVPVFFMCASGMFLMGSNRDMVLFLINSHIDVATYALILLSFCFVIMFYFYVLVDLYFALAGPQPAKYRVLEQHADRQSTSSQTSTLNHSDSHSSLASAAFV